VDNENDLTIAALSREESMVNENQARIPTEEQNIMLQESVSCISENLLYSVISPFFYPFNITYRRWLKWMLSIKIDFSTKF
jgi:hypothetical protein